ncbi:hypothetical protein EIN_372270 [Entamoeba invadens IP1]|uniref:SPIN90/Ldb17 leucine-rich domain-containing protein n=1 Tax=Entamoeba invadens IP1 TaxID=370355 RepID=A0A0A1UC40_ENTIV|nr:hypothetical protein EIN_372270 [Entamoeba invadens IP1]ELP92805.1 hypothetical protein EIN_372270 [Entamoeba invadens IP1]|eukprot:XP_004259576.1 hypothetical protein EIN_372270 [Entamoeba invadens IP1]
MASLRTRTNLSEQCHFCSLELKKIRDTKRSQMLSNNRLIVVCDTESPRLSPRSYLSNLTELYQIVNHENLTPFELDFVLDKVLQVSSRRDHPPMTEIFMSGLINKFFNLGSNMELPQKKVFLQILENITAADAIYHKELQKNGIVQFITQCAKEKELIPDTCGCICNLCLDSPEILSIVMKSKLLNTMIAMYENIVDIPYTLIWDIRVIVQSIRETSILSDFVMLAMNLLDNSDESFKYKDVMYIIIGEICMKDVSLLQPFLKKIVNMIVLACQKDSSYCTVALRTLEVITLKTEIPNSVSECIRILQIEHYSTDLTVKEFLLKCAVNMINMARTTELPLTLVSQNFFYSYMPRIEQSHHEKEKLLLLEVVILCALAFKCEEECFLDVNILQFIALVPMNNTRLVVLSLVLLQKVVSRNVDIESYVDEKLRMWFDKVLVSKQNNTVSDMAKALAMHIFIEDQMAL